MEGDLFDGWLANAMDVVIAHLAPAGRFEFRAGDEVASLVDGEVVNGPIEDADVRVEGDPDGIYALFVDRCFDLVTIDGDRSCWSSCSTSRLHERPRRSRSSRRSTAWRRPAPCAQPARPSRR